MMITIDMARGTVTVDNTATKPQVQIVSPKRGRPEGKKNKGVQEPGHYCQNKFCPTPKANLLQFGRKRAKVGGEEFYFCTDECKAEFRSYTKESLK